MGGSLRRTYDGLLLLLLASGFATLASTGGLAWPVVAVAVLVLALRLWLFAAGREATIPATAWLVGLLLYAPVFALDGFVLSHSFLQASLNFLVLAGAAKTFGPRHGHDDLTLGVLAFLEVLTAALLTVSGVFFLLFLLFLSLLVATLVAHEMVESGSRAGGAGGERRAAPPLLRFSVALSVVVAALSVGIFFLLPRTALGAWAGRPGAGGLTGFSDEVQLGAIARLQRTDQPVMHIRLTGQPGIDPQDFEHIPWRGRGLTDFDGQRWTSPAAPVLFSTRSGQIYDNPPLPHGEGEPAQIVSYQVTLEPLNTAVLFFPSRLLSASTRFPVLALDRASDTLAAVGGNAAGTSYSGVSDLAQPAANELRHAPSLRMRGYRAGYERRFLELPAGLDGRIPALARRIVASVPPDDYDRLQALSHYLQSHYQYTLEDLPQGSDPLAAFLFDQQAGDCEYFASALAVMARSLDIPVRLVNGFLLGSYNPISGEYLVRGRDAHTWVEAQFLLPSGLGGERYLSRVWVPFDPTPAVTTSASVWPGGAMMLDALSTAWQEWIVNYDWIRQAHLAGHLQDALDGDLAQAWSAGTAAASQAWQNTRSGVTDWPREREWPWTGSALVALGLVGANWSRRRRGRGWRLWPRRPATERLRAYRRFQVILARLGIVRRPAETARDLLTSLATRHPGAGIESAARAFVEKYERARFGRNGEADLDFHHELTELHQRARKVRAT